MELAEAFDVAQDEFAGRVHRIRADQWDNGTPCVDWSVRDLVNHLTGEHLWAPWLLRGATLEEVGDRFDGDVLGADPVASWDRAAAASRTAVHEPEVLEETVHTSGGLTPTDEYLRQMTLDLTVHAWDLARGIGADDRLDAELVELVYGYAADRVDSWQGVGVFDPPVEPPTGAGRQQELVALLGREP
ncbi:TIGR03086 family metal-binding protein [Streptomyces sp. 4N509B]|uniref:TIGR03086 family metal-binding protein n=1 Tax=Streptomyces sp. 4N509B TaxID=3457413 RepID=UPI003FD5F137